MLFVSWGHEGHQGIIDSAVFRRTVDWPEGFAPGGHGAPEDGTVLTGRCNKVGQPTRWAGSSSLLLLADL